MPSKGIFLEAEGRLSIRDITETYKPTGSESLVNVKYSAINPADIRHAFMGMFGTVTGYEFVGDVLEVGPESPFKVGQEVFGLSRIAAGKPQHIGSHQDYLLADAHSTYPVPEGVKPAEAVTMPVATSTVIDALTNMLGFALPAAGLDGEDATDRSVLIWGGSSMCGFYGIQLAKLAGFSPIFTTASAKNHEALKAIGATHCFDYRQPTVVEDIKAAVAASGKPLSVVFDAIASGLGVFEPASAPAVDVTKSTPALALQCCSDPTAEDLRLCAVLPVSFDPRWKLCLGGRPLGNEYAGMTQDPSWPVLVNKGVRQLYENHARNLTFPPRTIVKGAEEGVQAVRRVFDGKASLEKVVIEHPL